MGYSKQAKQIYIFLLISPAAVPRTLFQGGQMRRFYFTHIAALPQVMYGVLLLVGIIFGYLAALYADGVISSLMRMAIHRPVSIVSLSCVLIFPLLLAAFAVYLHVPWLLNWIGFGKSFGFSFCLFGVYLAFGREVGFTAFLLLFSDICMLLILSWFCLYALTGRRSSLRCRFAICVFAAVVTACIDILFIMPLVASL